jgi:hypothetical protein
MQGTFPWLFVQHQQQIDEDDVDNNRQQAEGIQLLEDDQQNDSGTYFHRNHVMKFQMYSYLVVMKKSIRSNSLVGISNQSELQTKKR